MVITLVGTGLSYLFLGLLFNLVVLFASRLPTCLMQTMQTTIYNQGEAKLPLLYGSRHDAGCADVHPQVALRSGKRVRTR